MYKKTMLQILLAFVISVFIFSTFACADDENSNKLLLLKAGQIDTEKVNESFNKSSEQNGLNLIAQSPEESEQYYIVQFTGPVKEEWKQNITSTGASIFNYIPNNAFVFSMSDDVLNQIRPFEFVQWVGEYKPTYKYDQELSGKESTFVILLFSTSQRDDIAGRIEYLGGNILFSQKNVLKVQMSDALIPEIASINGVSWIEEYIQPTLNNDMAVTIVNADSVHENYSLNGTGQIVAVCDTGLDTGVNDDSMHADIRGRILNIIDYSDNGPADDAPYYFGGGHGTHVSGSVLGNGALSGGQYAGTAPGSSLVFQAVQDSSGRLGGIDNLADISVLFQDAYEQGARIHTNSWGSNKKGDYTTSSQQVDQFMWDYPDMLILFSAGNDGDDDNYDGVVDEDSIGSPATAKNCLTVGASENYRPDITSKTYGSLYGFLANPIKSDYVADDIEGIAAFSSRGPTDDGRIKPDVVAPGTYIYSTKSSLVGGGAYEYMSGTSMATPITAGSAALVRQYYTDVECLSSPSAALIKASLINGAYSLTPGQYGTGSTQEISARPDYSQGWGRVDVDNTIYPQYPGVVRYYDKISLNTDESWNVSFNLSGESESLRATLVWTDYPGDAAVQAQLVNNLDLTVTGPGDIYYGNGAPDNVNNVEGVELIDPSEGTYTFSVSGTNIPQGPQNFSLVLFFAPDQNEYPQNGSTINNDTTEVSVDIMCSSEIDTGSIVMTIDDSEVPHTLEAIDDGYQVKYLTNQSYTQGQHNISVTALTDQSQQIVSEWIFYGDYPVSYEPILTDLTRSSNSAAVTLSWNQQHTDYVEVWRDKAFLTNTSSTQITDTDVQSYRIYKYSLRPVNYSEGKGDWYNISAVTVQPVSTYLTSSSSATTITLSWNLQYTDHVEVWRGQTFITNTSGTQITDTGLEPDTAYQYSLIPVNSGVRGEWHNISAATIKPVITNLTSSGNSTAITLSWNQEYTEHVEVWRNQTFIVNTSNTQITDAGLEANTAYQYSLKPVDSDGYTGNWTNSTVVTTSGNTSTEPLNTVDETSSESTESSGSSGGGGGSTGEEYENIEFKDVLSEYAGKDEVTDFKFSGEENEIDYIRYTSLKNAGKISVTVEVLKDTSTFVDTPAPGLVYQNVNIWVGKTGYATETNIKDPVIGFKIGRKWIEDNDIDPETIRMTRYNSGAWGILETKQTDSDEEYFYFEASTPGFSPFSIISETTVTASSEGFENTQVNAGSPMAIQDDYTGISVEEVNSAENRDLSMISPITIMFILGISCILYRKKRE